MSTKGETNLALALWVVLSIGLWLLLPGRYTTTDGPAAVVTMMVVGAITSVPALILAGKLRGIFKGG